MKRSRKNLCDKVERRRANAWPYLLLLALFLLPPLLLVPSMIDIRQRIFLRFAGHELHLGKLESGLNVFGIRAFDAQPSHFWLIGLGKWWRYGVWFGLQENRDTSPVND